MRISSSILLIAVIAALAGACGEVTGAPTGDDADPAADAGVDAAPDVDAPPDAEVPVDPRAAHAVVSAAGTVRAGALSLDVQLGDPFAAIATVGELSVTPHQPIAP